MIKYIRSSQGLKTVPAAVASIVVGADCVVDVVVGQTVFTAFLAGDEAEAIRFASLLIDTVNRSEEPVIETQRVISVFEQQEAERRTNGS